MDAPLDLVALRPMNAMIAAANTARTLGLRWKALGREPNAKDVESVTWAVYTRGLKVSGVEYVDAIAAVHAAGRKLAAFLANWDVLLTTTLPAPPPKLGYFDQNGDVQTFTERVTEYLSITPLHNATGTPAHERTAPLDAGEAPVGVHFAGRYGEEAMLLRLAALSWSSRALVRPAATGNTKSASGARSFPYEHWASSRNESRSKIDK
jgi:Asp-tRNA(Asn)/Glu-tRNA(Gln) amidotransferase A subunit family amidase